MDYGLPEDAVVLGEIHIVAYIDSDGTHSSGYIIEDKHTGQGMPTIQAVGLLEIVKRDVMDRSS